MSGISFKVTNLSKLGFRSWFIVVFYISSQKIVKEEEISKERCEMLEEEAEKCKRKTEGTCFDITGVFPRAVPPKDLGTK
jgi:hypothetical protein